MDAQRLYSRYHEFGDLSEKPKPSPDTPGSSFDYINRVFWREIEKAFALRPEKLGITEKPKTTPRTYPYPFGQSLADFERTAKLCGCADCQRYLKSKETNDMPTYHNVSIDLRNISSNSSSRITDEQILGEMKALAKEDPGFARKLKETAEQAEHERKAGIERALGGVNFLAMQEGHGGRDFCISFWKNGEAHSLDGTDYAYDQHIKETEIDDEHRVFVSGGVWPVSGVYSTMDNLKQRLERNDVLYTIEYYPDQD